MKKILTGILIGIWILLLVFMGGVTYLIVNPDKARYLNDRIQGKPTPEQEAAALIAASANQGPKPYGYQDLINPEPVKDDSSGGLEESLEETYVKHSSADISLPERMAEKTGYDPISASEKEITAADAVSRYNSLSEGNPGDGLEFDPEFYPYYNMLGEKAKHLYRQIYQNALDLNSSFKPVEQDLGTLGFKNVFSAVIGDHPELFWLDTAYECLYDPYKRLVEVDLKFNETASDLDASKAEFYGAAEEILSGAREFKDPGDKEKFVHDALIVKADYDRNAAMNQSAYSALVNGNTVCAGYSRAMQYLMQELDIPCYYCTGYVGEDHAWNILKLDDDYYNVDPTWDDTEGGEYDYFNRSDDDFAPTHARTELSIYLPSCRGGRFSPQEPVPEEESETPADEGEDYYAPEGEYNFIYRIIVH